MTKLSAKKLRDGIEDYFAGISREVEVKETISAGRDEKGRELTEEVTALNGRGEPVLVTEYLVPPSILDLQHHLSLTAAQWQRAKTERRTGALATAAEARVERYLRRELLTRPGKDLKGIVLTLQKDFGFDETEVEADEHLLEALLREGSVWEN